MMKNVSCPHSYCLCGWQKVSSTTIQYACVITGWFGPRRISFLFLNHFLCTFFLGTFEGAHCFVCFLLSIRFLRQMLEKQ